MTLLETPKTATAPSAPPDTDSVPPARYEAPHQPPYEVPAEVAYAPSAAAATRPTTMFDAISELAPIGLPALTEQASLQTRVDRKYLVPRDVIARVVHELSGNLNALEMSDRRFFRYQSVYFDTDDYQCFRSHVQGRRRRFKVRTRAYLDSGECQLEVKMEGGRSETVKSRLPYHPDEAFTLSTAGRAYIDDIVNDADAVRRLRPVLMSHYRRATLIDLQAQTRLTCDIELEWLTSKQHSGTPTSDVLVETKTLGPLGDADKLLRTYGHRPVSISKYCIGVAMLNPEMNSNPWHRLISRHFDWALSLREDQSAENVA